jgi:hypothetical protein
MGIRLGGIVREELPVASRSLNPRLIESSNASPPANVIFLAKKC